MTNAALAFDALGDPTRRAIFERVASRPQSVGKLAERMSVSRPAVSQHLKVLKGAGLVSDRPEGTRRIYSVDLKGVMAMRGYLEKFWDGALAAFQAAADEPDEPDEPDESGETVERGEENESGETVERGGENEPRERVERSGENGSSEIVKAVRETNALERDSPVKPPNPAKKTNAAKPTNPAAPTRKRTR